MDIIRKEHGEFECKRDRGKQRFNGQEVVESHDCPRLEGKRHIEKDNLNQKETAEKTG